MIIKIILIFQLIDIQAKIVICTSETYTRVAKAIKDVERHVEHKIKLFSFGPVQELENICEDIVTTVSETDENEAPAPVILDDNELDKETAIIFWTSGTTGLFWKDYGIW